LPKTPSQSQTAWEGPPGAARYVFSPVFSARKLEKASKRPFLPSKSHFSLTFCLKKVNASPLTCFTEEKKVNVAAQVRFT
jgi:aspartate aminotransferase-like enzyme